MGESRMLTLVPLPSRERKGPIAEQWEGEGAGAALRIVLRQPPHPPHAPHGSPPSPARGEGKTVTATALALLARRMLTALPIMLIVAALVFTVLRLLPADPLGMSLPPNASQADVAAMRAEMGFDRPIAEQFMIWLGHLSHGDLGSSIHFRRRVAGMILAALPTTLELVAFGLTLGVAIGVAFGMTMFACRGTLREQLLDVGSTVVMSIPEFLWAILLILGVGVGLGLLPFIGRIDPQTTVPATTGAAMLVPLKLRYGR